MKKVILATTIVLSSLSAIAGTGQVGSVNTNSAELTIKELIVNANQYGENSKLSPDDRLESSIRLRGKVLNNSQGDEALPKNCSVLIEKVAGKDEYLLADGNAAWLVGVATVSGEQINAGLNNGGDKLKVKAVASNGFTIKTEAELYKGKLLAFKQTFYDPEFFMGIPAAMWSKTCIVDLSAQSR